jgi:hypothetical protein
VTDNHTNSIRTLLSRLGQYLNDLPPGPSPPAPDRASPGFEEESDYPSAELAELIRKARAERRRRTLRARHLPAGLFGEPAWDLLLDIFANRAEGKRVSFSSTCLATGVPAGEAARWINVLEAEGLLFRRRDHKDRACLWLDLTDLGMERLCAHFRDIRTGTGF